MKTLAILINIFLPGVGTFFVSKVGEAIGQILIYWIGVFFCFTGIGLLIGLPMMLAAWIWGLVSAIGANPQPIQVTVNNTTTPDQPFDRTVS